MIVESAYDEMKWHADKTQVDSFIHKSASEGHVFCLSLHDKAGQFLRIQMTLEEKEQLVYAIQDHGPAVDVGCPRCGNKSYRVVIEQRGPHFGTVECARCGRFVRWASRKEALKAASLPQPKPLREETAEYLRADSEAPRNTT